MNSTHKALESLVEALKQYDPIHEYDYEHPKEWLVANIIEASTDYLKWASSCPDQVQGKARLLRIVEAILPLWDRAHWIDDINIDAQDHGC